MFKQMLLSLTHRSMVLSMTISLAWVMGVGCDKSDSATPTTTAAGGATPVVKLSIGVVAKSTVNVYWKAVEAGARQAATEENVDITWIGPDAETNHSQQANMVDNLVNKGVGGIVLSPTNVDALVRPVESAVAKGVPVILIDSTLNSVKPLSVIATDNFAAGKQAAEAMVKAIGANKPNGGKVIMLRYLEGSGSTEAREKGFIEAINAAGLTVVESMYTKGGGSTTDAFDTADALLRRYTTDGVVKVDGIFASNQPTAIGMLTKIEQMKGQAVKIDCPFVGFDAHELLLKGVRDGTIAAIVVQDPKMMGYRGVKEMVNALHGKPVAKTISTATATVTKDNIDTPAIKAATLE